MPAVNSKEEGDKLTERQARLLKQVKHLIFLNLSAWLMMIPARPEMVLRVTQGDALKTAQILGSMTGGAALFEFLVTPAMGRITDKYGRKPVLLACSIICFVFRFLDTLLCDGGYKSVIAANWLDRIFAGACFPAFFTVVKAALSDAFLGKKLALYSSELAQWIGLGVMFGPFVGAKVLAMTGSPKYTCLTASMFSVLTALYVHYKFEETLPEEKRKEIDTKALNPFAFRELWKGRAMSLMCLAILFQGITVDMHDVKMVLLKTKLGFDPNMIGRYMIGSGLQSIAGGILGKVSMAKLDAVAHTSIAHLALIGNMVSWATAETGAGIALALAFDAVAGGRRLAVDAALTSKAAALGLGKGQIQAAIANMLNLCKVVGPVVYTVLFARFGQKAPFMLGIALTCAAHAVFQKVGKDIKIELAKS